MANDNPFFALQQRLADLLEAHAYFTGLTAKKQILTEKIADLEFAIMQVALPMGFGVVVTTAAGKSRESSYEALLTTEDLNVSIMHNPKTDLQHTALDGLFAAVEAIHGKSVQVTAPPAARPHDLFAVLGHQRRHDGPPGCHIHELHIQGGLRLA